MATSSSRRPAVAAVSATDDAGRLLLRVLIGLLVLFHGISKILNGLGPILGLVEKSGLPPAVGVALGFAGWALGWLIGGRDVALAVFFAAITPTATVTPTLTNIVPKTATVTKTPTFTRTPTATMTITPTGTDTATATPTSTNTTISTSTPTFTPTATPGVVNYGAVHCTTLTASDSIITTGGYFGITVTAQGTTIPAMATGMFNFWKDTDANKVYLIYNDGTGTKKVQLQ